MHNLCRRKTIILTSLLIIFFSVNTWAQAGNYNYRDFQRKPYYFGITLGYNSSDYKIFRSKEFQSESNEIDIIKDINGPGFNLGIVTNLKVGEYFDFRFLPTLSFAERNISYISNFVDGLPVTSDQKLESVYVELPFHARYKSAPYKDMRLFVIAGIKYSFDVAGESRRQRDLSLVKLASADFSVEVGAGVQFFFPFFIFSPEFKISQGISNILISEPTKVQASVIEKILNRTFTISLHFEG